MNGKHAIGDCDAVCILSKRVAIEDLFPSNTRIWSSEKELYPGTCLLFEVTSMAGCQTLEGQVKHNSKSKVGIKIDFFKKMKLPVNLCQIPGDSISPENMFFFFVYNGADFVDVSKAFNASGLRCATVHLHSKVCLRWTAMIKLKQKDAELQEKVAKIQEKVAEIQEKEAMLAQLTAQLAFMKQAAGSLGKKRRRNEISS